jgi:hypothetical protein
MNQPTVVWDWDGTLAETIPDRAFSRFVRGLFGKKDNALSLGINREGKAGHFLLYVRPGVRELLDLLQVHYQLVLWTYAVPDYIHACLHASDLKDFFPADRIITRADMQAWNAHYKDLFLLNQRFYAPLDQTVIIDDGNAEFGLLNPYNCIDIPAWNHTQLQDMSLMSVPKLIEQRLAYIASRGEEELKKHRASVLSTI